MTKTFAIALYGAILSTLTIIIHFLNYLRDRANIVITVTGGMKMLPPSTDNRFYVLVDIANRGRRPVTISKCCVRMPRGAEAKWMILNDSFYKQGELLEGKSQIYTILQEEVEKYNLTYKDLVVCGIDATGRYYWADNFLNRFIKLAIGSVKIKKKI